jgi:putative FmdB family regulatory protein
MPTYAYQCDQCGHQFDEFQSFKDEPLKTCPKCSQNALRRLISAGAALLFKGSGFYITDYRSESYKAAAKAEGGSTGTKTDSAPAKGSSGGESTPKASTP